jgi:UDP-3-O-[3-hydroxymyristoyl] N-acetylglucosamine deacetylase / 3-hydroxyacyl-[acyl-carrier-protein] dehydratase
MKQRTIVREVSIEGKSLHTGNPVQITFKPAPVGSGIIFQRVDIYGKPLIKPNIAFVGDLVRNTTLTDGNIQIHTVEHVLSTLRGMGIDNVLVEMDASEPPILDGSAKHFVNLLQQAEITDQDADREIFSLIEPVSVTQGNRSIIALPYDGFKITCTSADDRGIHTQHLSIDIDPTTYIAQIAPARTFSIYEDIEPLIKLGKIQGGTLDSAIVIKGNQILSKEPLRFQDEFVRHKILDIVGDLMLLGMPLNAHIVAVRPGHALNAELTKKIYEQMRSQKSGKVKAKPAGRSAVAIEQSETSMDIRRLLQLMPHRYPFVMIDRVVELKNDNELTAIKNVTINEPFFQGHFPGYPVMPGVLQIEAMAQAAGLLLLRHGSNENRVALFMSCDKVKFRKAVVPGDQLVIDVKLLKVRGEKIATAEAHCRVGDKVVSSAELMFSVMELSETEVSV